MEWYIMNASGVRSLAGGLVDKVSDCNYIVSDECIETIEELLEKLNTDNVTTSVTKRHLLAEQIVTKDLVPIIKFASPDVNELQYVLQLFSKLCELFHEDILVSASALDVKQDIYKLRDQVRNAFLDIAFVEKLFQHIKELISEAGTEEMAEEGYEAIKFMLHLIRNVLYCSKSERSMKQTALRGLLLKNGLGSVLIYSIASHGKYTLAVPVSQILSLLYADFQWEWELSNLRSATTQVFNEELYAHQYVYDKLKLLVVQLVQGPLSTLTITLRRKELLEADASTHLSQCVAYFLQFAGHVNVSFEHISGILSQKCVGYLVYQAYMLAISLFSGDNDSATHEHDKYRVMVVFSALEKIITTLRNFQLASVNTNEVKRIMRFYRDLVEMTDFWNLMLLYIRNFDSSRFPRSFLAQLICINHELLSATEFYNQMCSVRLEDTMLQHIKQFASPEVIQRYTLLVDTYATNSAQTNMAVFTMFCHICVDCQMTNVLYTPTLLQLLGAISDSPDAADEDRKLAKFIITSFLDDLSSRPEVCVEKLLNFSMEDMDSSSAEEEVDNKTTAANTVWTDSEESDLFSIYADIEDKTLTDDTVALMCHELAKLGVIRSKQEIIDKLKLMITMEDDGDAFQVQMNLLAPLVSDIVQDGNEGFIYWIQHGLLTASHIKAMPKSSCSKTSPLCWYSVQQGHGCPLFPCAESQSELMSRDCKAIQLLDTLELPYQQFNGSVLPIIPDSSTAAQLYIRAQQLKSAETAAIGMRLESSIDTCDATSTASDEDLCRPMAKTTLKKEPSLYGQRREFDENLWIKHLSSRGKV